MEQDGELMQVDPDEVPVGGIIVVQPGEKIPIDGVVTEGRSSLNTSALTGESVPSSVKEGEEVISGCINLTGVLKIRTAKEFGESTVSKILDLVENASSRKSKSEDFISKFARVYTPLVCYSALALAFLPPLVRMAVLGLPADFGDWIYRALTFLVISCPCALVVSIPLSFFAGIGGASNAGVLIKGSNYMETMSRVKCVVFDKTGTMTQGVFEVIDVHHSRMEREKLLEYAALAECASSHPISKSLKKAYGRPIDRSRVTNIREISGSGVIAQVDGITVAAGNVRLMRHLQVEYKECRHVGTIVHMAVNGVYEGHIVISDRIKPHAREAVAALKSAGVSRTVMLTGDTGKASIPIARELEMDYAYTNLLPEDKLEHVEDFLSIQGNGERVVCIGDGINDAPILARADVGIAMGAMGASAASQAADVILIEDELPRIVDAIQIARETLKIVNQNITFALLIKVIVLVLAVTGWFDMWEAILAEVGVMFVAILNSTGVTKYTV